VQGAVGQAAGQAVQGAQDVAGGAAAQQAGGGRGAQGQQSQATSGASQKAEELGVDLSEVEGTGPGGRITLKDVKSATENG
jgi:pyruvate dehydrogenase E2 component (dihydrolipoamide acetyltransferase)